jgi:hypothetical protein
VNGAPFFGLDVITLDDLLSMLTLVAIGALVGWLMRGPDDGGTR